MQPLYNLNFLGLPEELRDPDTARFAVLPVPYDATCSYGTGTRHGPAAILTASQQVELYDPELDCEPANAGVITLEPLMPEISGPEAMVDSVREEVGAILDDRKIPLVLGGEHTVTVGAVRAMAEKKALGSILVVDAHADLRESYQGSPYSHASATRRLSELGLPIHVVGARNISRDEMDWYRAQDLVKIHWDHELRDRKISEWTAEIATALQSPVYISIDLDGLDPAIMPATGTPEPGGLSWQAVTQLIQATGARHTICGADVVELEPIPGQHGSDFLAARLIVRLMAAME